jgi:DNA-binding IclR family transcriptional regulator
MAELRAFVEKGMDDPRMGLRHIGLYAVLFALSEGEGPERYRRNEVMSRAKIRRKGAYYKLLQELHEMGYIEYLPEYAPGRTRIRVV